MASFRGKCSKLCLPQEGGNPFAVRENMGAHLDVPFVRKPPFGSKGNQKEITMWGGSDSYSDNPIFSRWEKVHRHI